MGLLDVFGRDSESKQAFDLLIDWVNKNEMACPRVFDQCHEIMPSFLKRRSVDFIGTYEIYVSMSSSQDYNKMISETLDWIDLSIGIMENNRDSLSKENKIRMQALGIDLEKL